ncbi:MAG: peptidoglycan-recognition protein SC2-like [Elusimicrobia bacterium]|nr:MAG: peptidoglycan-recognition protein SC2-like [Elusimicrobiota bacterium]KAF0154989.1 MAG: peptidoglycan-recognition protein SC2-like [Elusimicrobiota bacterium]
MMKNTASLIPAFILSILSSAAFATTGGDNPVVFKKPYPLSAEISASEKIGAVVMDTGFSQASPVAIASVLVQGEMPEAGLELQLLVEDKFLFFDTSAKFSPAKVKLFPNGRFWARFDLAEATRSPLRLKAINRGVKAAHTLIIYEVEAMTSSPQGEDKSRTGDGADVTGTVPPREQSIYLPRELPFQLVRRAEWKAAPPKENYEAHTPARITFHHTAGRKPASVAAAYAEVQFIQDYHMNGKKWNDIGYHFLVDPFGTIFEGRPVGVIGAHVLYRNPNNIGVSVLGNYHPPVSDQPDFLSLAGIVDVGHYLAGAYAMPPAEFFGHRDLGASSCPGDHLYAYKETLRGAIFLPPLSGASKELADLPSPDITSPALNQLENWGHNTYFDGR